MKGDKKRLKKSEIYHKIMEVLKTGDHNILQISEKAVINWVTVRNALNALENIGVVSKNQNIYQLNNSCILEKQSDTLLGMPISKEQRLETLSLAKRITELWIKTTNKPLQKTFLQKILVKTIKKDNIKTIPYGLYLFGECTVLQLDPIFSSNLRSNTNHDNTIIGIINDFSKFNSTNELLKNHYLETNNDLYFNRLVISNILMNKFDGNSVHSLKTNLNNFLFSFKKSEDNEEIIDLFRAMISTLFGLINELKINELEDLRNEMIESFKALWELVATYKIYDSITNYDREFAKKYYILSVSASKEIAENYLQFLNDNIPKKEISKDLSKFKGIWAKQSQ